MHTGSFHACKGWREDVLVDGAIVENVPVAVLREMGAKVCLGVDLGSGGYRQPESLVEVVLNAFSIAN